MTQSLSSESELVAANPPGGWRERIGRLMLGRSLAECVESGRDNILQLRLLAALMVVFGHSYVLVGYNKVVEDPIHRLLPMTGTHIIGVMMFFTISGFLITLSYQRRPHLLRFLRARLLRLWPALIVCVAAWSFVLGPILTTLPLHEYFVTGNRWGNAATYFLWNVSLLDVRPFLPGVFANNPVASFVNASLWTIPYEAKMYLCVAGVGILGLLRFPLVTSIAIAAVFAKLILWPMYTGTVHSVGTQFLGLVLTGFFGAGAIACLMRRYVPISTGLLILTVGTCILVRGWQHATPFLWLAVVYFVFWLAYVPRLPSIPRNWDLSYGTYLWAFPLQQVVIMFTGVREPLALFTIVTPIVLVIAIGSWLLIEKPALRLKDWRWRRSTRLQPA